MIKNKRNTDEPSFRALCVYTLAAIQWTSLPRSKRTSHITLWPNLTSPAETLLRALVAANSRGVVIRSATGRLCALAVVSLIFRVARKLAAVNAKNVRNYRSWPGDSLGVCRAFITARISLSVPCALRERALSAIVRRLFGCAQGANLCC